MIEIVGAERDSLLLHILERIESDTQVIGAPERTETWQKGWEEALNAFRLNPVAESLMPAFIRENQPVRIQQRFWHVPVGYEREYVRNVQKDFLAPNFKDCESVYEFGCGTGLNLVALAGLDREKNYKGLDFAQAAVDLVREASDKLDLPILAERFDMLRPFDVGITEGTGVLTFGAVEQLASRFEPFIEYLISSRAKIVCHVEPVPELYDPTNLVDALALRFHRKRGYTEGLLPYLKKHPKVEMILVERAYFGSLMQEGYSRIIWRPR